MRQFDWLIEIINFKTVKMKNTGHFTWKIDQSRNFSCLSKNFDCIEQMERIWHFDGGFPYWGKRLQLCI